MLQPARPPGSANDPAMTDRNARRLTPSGQPAAWRGNSLSSIARNSGVSASSSSERQYSGPVALARRSRSAATSRRAVIARSSVARRAIGPARHVILANQSTAERELIAAGWFPTHGGDLRPWPQVTLGLAMTGEAPLHLERVHLPGERHAIHAAVAAFASDALREMDAVVEVHEVGKIVNAIPDDRLPRPVALAHRLEHSALVPDLAVAVHAHIGGRNPRECAVFHARVAVAAVDAVVRDVVLVTEHHGLRDGYAHTGRVRRPLEDRDTRERADDDE